MITATAHKIARIIYAMITNLTTKKSPLDSPRRIGSGNSRELKNKRPPSASLSNPPPSNNRVTQEEHAPRLGGQRRDELQPVEFLPQEAQISQNQRITIPINLCLLWPFPHEVSQEKYAEFRPFFEFQHRHSHAPPTGMQGSAVSL